MLGTQKRRSAPLVTMLRNVSFFYSPKLEQKTIGIPKARSCLKVLIILLFFLALFLITPLTASAATVTTEQEFANAITAHDPDIVIANDINLAAERSISYNARIRSEGSPKTLYWNGVARRDVLTLSGNATLTLENVTLDGLDKYVTLVLVKGSNLVMNEGATLRNTRSDASDTAVIVGSISDPSLGGTFTMNGGLITGIALDSTTSVFNGTMTMKGSAAIKNNSARGINLSAATLNMGGTAEISNNTAAREGVGIIASSSSVIHMGLVGGDAPRISGNTSSSSYCGGIFMSGTCSLTMDNDSSINNNTGLSMGGGVGMVSSSLTMAGNAEIRENHAQSGRGGGIVAQSSSSIFMYDDSSISGNIVEGTAGTGGGLSLQATTLEMNDAASISANQASSGSGIYASSGTSMTVGKDAADAPTITGNIASVSGGGVFIASGASATLAGDTAITENTAVTGKGIYQAGTLQISQGAQITDGLYFDSEITSPSIVGALSEHALIQLEASDYVAEINAPIVVAKSSPSYAPLPEHESAAFIAPPSLGTILTAYVNASTDQVLLGFSHSLGFEGVAPGSLPNNPAYYIEGRGIDTLAPPDPAVGFLGWFSAEQGGVQVSSIPADAVDPVVLWARYQEHHISYEGLSVFQNANNPASYFTGFGLDSLNPPVPPNDFIAWFDAEEGGNPVTSIPASSNEDLTLWARFQAPDDPFSYRTLVDPVTGVSVSGLMTDAAALTVALEGLHDVGTCPVCDEIRYRDNTGDVIAFYELSISDRYSGVLEVSLPVSADKNGEMVTILHCDNRERDTVDTLVSDALAQGTFTKLSPFAVLQQQADPAISGLPLEYTMTVGESVSWTPLPAGGMWNYSSDYLSLAERNGTYTFTAESVGQTTATYLVDGMVYDVNITIAPAIPTNTTTSFTTVTGSPARNGGSATTPKTSDESLVPIVLIAFAGAVSGSIALRYRRNKRTL